MEILQKFVFGILLILGLIFLWLILGILGVWDKVGQRTFEIKEDLFEDLEVGVKNDDEEEIER